MLLAESRKLVGFWSWEVRPDFVFADPVMAAYFGLDEEDGKKGQPLERYMEAIHEQDRDRIRLAISKAVAPGDRYSEVYRVKTLYGDERIIRAEGRCFHDAKGRPHLYPGHISDITAEATLSGSLSQINEHLSCSLEIARAAHKPFLQHLIAMAVLECSDDKSSPAAKKSRMN